MKTPEALLLINQRIRSLSAYHLEPIPVDIKLNQNENPYDRPAELKEELAQFCRRQPWNRYPDFVPKRLKEVLAGYVGVESGNIIAGNGSNEMLLVLMLAVGGEGRKVILCEPTFTIYRLLSVAIGAEVMTVRLRSDLSYDVEELCRIARQHPGAVMVLASPNNPTGNALKEEEVLLLLNAHRGILILDQAYVEFGGFSAVSLVKEFANLIITRTFSKAWGAAGLRLGYLIGNERVVEEINKVKLPYNINIFCDYAARLLMRRRDLMERHVAQIRAERDELFAFLSTLPLDVCYPSVANFILVRTSRAEELCIFLQKRGILIRDVSNYPMLENCLRLSVGTPEENAVLRKALSTFFLG